MIVEDGRPCYYYKKRARKFDFVRVLEFLFRCGRKANHVGKKGGRADGIAGIKFTVQRSCSLW
jgi:hypothetical protein